MTEKRQRVAVKITAVLAVIAWIVAIMTLCALPAYAAGGTLTAYYNFDSFGSISTAGNVSIVIQSVSEKIVVSNINGSVAIPEYTGDHSYRWTLYNVDTSTVVQSGYVGVVDGEYVDTYTRSTNSSRNYELYIEDVG